MQGGGAYSFRARSKVLGDVIHSAPIYVGDPELDWPSPVDYTNCPDISDFDDSTSVFPKLIYNCQESASATSNDPSNDYSNLTGTFAEYYGYSSAGESVTDNGHTFTYHGQKGRSGVIYFGANDGMLHGVRESDGQEVMAYIPEFVTSTNAASGLHYLTESTYNHKYYVDLSSTVSDVYIDHDGDGDKEWRTVLAGGGAAGGRGIFVLDVTNPVYSESDNTANNGTTGPAELVLFEFSNKDYDNLGYVFGKPAIVPFKQGTQTKWAVVISNGYNPDTSLTDTSGHAELIVLFLDADLDSDSSPQTEGWTEGQDFIVLDTEVGTTGTLNGLSGATLVDVYDDDTVDEDAHSSDRIIDRAYAGDVFGNLWVFDLRDALPSNPASHTWGSAYDTSGVPDPLFATSTITYSCSDPRGSYNENTGRCNQGDVVTTVTGNQPITVNPTVVKNSVIADNDHATNGNLPNLMVYFGTGQYLATGDASTTHSQSFYGIWDNGSDNNLDRSHLSARTFIDNGSSVNAQANAYVRILDRVADPAASIYENNLHGWKIDLPESGERVVVNPHFRNDILFLNTSIPDVDSCSGGGSGWLMSVEAISGGQPDDAVFDLNNDNTVTESGEDRSTNPDLVFDGTDTYNAPSGVKTGGLPTGSTTRGKYKYDVRADGSIIKTTIRDSGTDGGAVGRLSWKEISPTTGH